MSSLYIPVHKRGNSNKLTIVPPSPQLFTQQSSPSLSPTSTVCDPLETLRLDEPKSQYSDGIYTREELLNLIESPLIGLPRKTLTLMQQDFPVIVMNRARRKGLAKVNPTWKVQAATTPTSATPDPAALTAKLRAEKKEKEIELWDGMSKEYNRATAATPKQVASKHRRTPVPPETDISWRGRVRSQPLVRPL